MSPQHGEEYRQAWARVALSAVSLLICLTPWFNAATAALLAPRVTVAIVALHLFLSLGCTFVVRWQIGSFAARRLTILAIDLAWTSFGTYVFGELGAAFYPVYIAIVIGNGMRFGPRYLYIAMVGAAAAYGGVLAWSPHWQQQPPVVFSLMVGMCVLPLFYARLVHGLHAANNELTREKQELLRTREQLHDLAMRDSLTGLWNRRTVVEHLALQLERTRRDTWPLTVLLADVDHFKAVNDLHGHQAGDLVLVEVASRLAAELRPYDIVGRYGGEELILVLPGVDGPAALECANRLREAVAAPVRLPNQTVLAVTCSFGFTTIAGGESATAEDLIRQADSALYAAKRRGRNRVEEAPLVAA